MQRRSNASHSTDDAVCTAAVADIPPHDLPAAETLYSGVIMSTVNDIM